MSDIQLEWMETKIQIAQGIRAGKFKEVHKFLQKLYHQFELPPGIEGQILGMLFILDSLLPHQDSQD